MSCLSSQIDITTRFSPRLKPRHARGDLTGR
jgi:hypothetical protein